VTSERYPYAAWTTETLIEYEQQLYDEEVSGADVWPERDQVLVELNARDFK
jgi:hypothetical protein